MMKNQDLRISTLFSATWISLCALILTSCGQTSPQNSEFKTNLGPAGNAEVREMLDQYRQKPADRHCNNSGQGRRVIITGFSSFQSMATNPTGTIVRTMADPKWWPESVEIRKMKPSGFEWLGEKSRLQPTDFGGVAAQRQLVIDGQHITACFILLEVLWDLAASIILDEAERFEPDAIIMTGGGNTAGAGVAQFEVGAVNRAMQLSGYYSSGQAALNNIPQIESPASYAAILPESQIGVRYVEPMRWNAPQLAEITRPLALAITANEQPAHYDVVHATSTRESNAYLCNNTAYVVLAAARGLPISLANGEVVFEPSLHLSTELEMAGFLHIPDLDTLAAETILGWAKLIAQTAIADQHSL